MAIETEFKKSETRFEKIMNKGYSDLYIAYVHMKVPFYLSPHNPNIDSQTFNRQRNQIWKS